LDRIEEPDNAAFDFDGMRDRQLALEQIPNGLGDHRLSISGGTVDEHRVGGPDGWSDLIEHALAEHKVRKRFSHPAPRDRPRHGLAVCLQIGHVLFERDGRYADVLAALHEQHGALPAGVGDAIPIRWTTNAGTADDLALVQPFDEIDGRLHDRELQAETLRNFDSRELARVMQQLEQQLNNEVEGEPGRVERHRRARMERRRLIHRVRGVSQHVGGHR
jgi:hypothetical protein